MADNIQATPRNYVGGLLTDAYKWMQSPERTQQMQGFASLLGTTGVPQTIERLSYADDGVKGFVDALTNVNKANVPLLKPETADALMTVAPFAGPAARGSSQLARGVGRLAGSAVNDAMVYGRGPLAGITPQPMRMANDDFANITQNIEGLLGQSKAASKIDEPMRTFKTSDGYTLYETKEGKIVDNLDPDSVDMSWDNYKQLKDDFGDDVYQVGDDLGKRKSATSSTGNPNLLDDWYSYRAEPTKDELFQQALNKQNEPKKASIVPMGAAETNARKAIEDLMSQARYFGVDSPIDYTKMPVGSVMQDLDSYLGMSKQVADLPDAAKTSLRNLWYKAEDAAKAYKRVYGENKLMGKPEEAANDARKTPMLWDEKKLKKLLKDGTFTQEEYDNALAWNKKNRGL